LNTHQVITESWGSGPPSVSCLVAIDTNLRNAEVLTQLTLLGRES